MHSIPNVHWPNLHELGYMGQNCVSKPSWSPVGVSTGCPLLLFADVIVLENSNGYL